MPPAVHIAVFDHSVFQQCAHFVQLGDDIGIGFPDKLAAKVFQIRLEHAIALHRTQNIVLMHAVFQAGIEVVFTIGRRRVNDTGTGIQLDIIRQIDGRITIVQRMLEVD